MANNLQKIYGCVYKETICDYGMKAFAIANGEIIAEHISSNESFARCDLGFHHKPSNESKHHSDTRKDLYKKLFPNGYELIWLGIKSHEEIGKLLNN